MKASKKFAQMSESQFEDYLYNNPGGAAKAFRLRCEGGPRGETKTRVEYRDRVVEREVEVPGPERVVTKVKEKKVRFIPQWMKVLTGLSVVLSVGSMMSVSQSEVREVVKEVSGQERVVEVPGPIQYVDREVVKEVMVDNPEHLASIKELERRERQLEKAVYEQNQLIRDLHFELERETGIVTRAIEVADRIVRVLK